MRPEEPVTRISLCFDMVSGPVRTTWVLGHCRQFSRRTARCGDPFWLSRRSRTFRRSIADSYYEELPAEQPPRQGSARYARRKAIGIAASRSSGPAGSARCRPPHRSRGSSRFLERRLRERSGVIPEIPALARQVIDVRSHGNEATAVSQASMDLPSGRPSARGDARRNYW